MTDQLDSGEQELEAGKAMSDTPAQPDAGPSDTPAPPEESPERSDVPAIPGETAVPESSDAAAQTDGAAPDTDPGGDLGDEPEPAEAPSQRNTKDAEGAGDTDSIVESPEDVKLREAAALEPNWQRETSAHRIAVELKRIESEVRAILDVQDSRRKRKLTGSRRWRELEEDMIRWHFTSRIDQSALKRLSELVPKRNFLFQRLHFLAGTRVGWNT